MVGFGVIVTVNFWTVHLQAQSVICYSSEGTSVGLRLRLGIFLPTVVRARVLINTPAHMLPTTCVALLLLPMAIVASPPFLVLQDFGQQGVLDDVKVPVQLGVMSRCPDALLCENIFDQVLKKVADKVDLSLLFVAKINSSEPDFGVTCLHGRDECAGNVQQLCTAKYSPSSNWWEFVQCLNYQGRDKIGSPEVALNCARAAGIDWETSGSGQCAGLDGSGKGLEGVQLLRESIMMSRQLGIEKSCTVLINGRKVCIHDGTWKECEDGHTVNDFVKQINSEFDRLNNAN